MSIHNINSIQSKLDLLNSSYTDEYILQSLANLGQRLSVKGDSISTNSFLFSDLFYSGNTYGFDDYIGEIDLEDDNIIFKVLDRTNFSIIETIGMPFVNNLIILKDNNKFVLDTPINNIDEYKNCIIKNNLTNYTIKLDCYTNNKIVEIFICDFNKYTYNIEESIKIKCYNDNIIAYHLLYDVLYNKYELNVFIINNKLNDLEYIKENINELLNNNDKINKFSTKYIYDNLILNKFKKIQNKNKLEIDYSNKFFTVSKTVINYLGIDTLKTDIENFNNDVNILFKNIKQLFSNKTYLENNDGFHHQLLIELYKNIYAVSKYSKVYIPINYKLNYYCNSNNKFEIYSNVKDIIVKFIEPELSVKTVNDFYDNDSILVNTYGSTKTILYNYEIEYDNTLNNVNKIINNINIVQKYVLPYINKDYLWVVDNITTEIKAKGIDAGNPNLIIVYNKSCKLNDFEILAGAKKQELLTNVPWKLTQTYINIGNISNKYILNDTLDIANCWIPNLEFISKDKIESFTELFKYSIIVSISSYNCIEINNSEELYDENSLITTFWQYDEINNVFSVIKNNSLKNSNNIIPALDLTTLSNIDNITKFHINNTVIKEPDKYTHSWLVFDKAYITLKNTQSSGKRNIYGTLRNYKASYISNDSIQYNNDLNLILQYTENVVGAEENNISSVGQIGQPYYYLSTVNNSYIAIESTNRLYTYHDNLKKYHEYIPNTNVPLFNLKEMLIQNINTLNRVNILSIEYENEDISYLYNGYFGTSFDEDRKARLHIGTSNTNINIGNNTLLNKSDNNKFKTHTYLDIDLPYINMNGVLNLSYELNTYHPINVYDNIWNVKTPIQEVNSTNGNTFTYTVKSTEFTPVSKYFGIDSNLDKNTKNLSSIQLNNTSKISSDENGNYDSKYNIIEQQLINYYNYAIVLGETVKDNISKINIDSLKLWVPLFFVLPYDENNPSEEIKNQHTFFTKFGDETIKLEFEDYLKYTKDSDFYIKNLYYLGEALFIPSLLIKLGLNNWFPQNVNNDFFGESDTSNLLDISSNGNIITLNDYPLFLVTKNRFIEDEISFEKSNNSITTQARYTIPNEIFIGNNLSITYVLDSTFNQNIKITLNECKYGESIILPYKVNYNYTTSYNFSIINKI